MTAPTLDAIADKLADGTPLDRTDYLALAATTDLVQLGMLASDARRRRMGDEVTYVRVVEHKVGDPLPDAWPATAGEIRLVGVPPTAEAAIAKAWAAVERANGIPVTAWALADLVALAKDLDGLGTLARGLREAGVAGLADVRLDLVEDPAVQWVVDAGLGVPVVGVHDAPANPVVFLRRVASLQKATKAFRAVAPLPRRVSTEAPSTGYDDVKLIALAALLVDGVGRVQVDWRQHGAKLSQVALLFGANDLDHVPATDDAPLGPRRAPLEEVRRNILAASLTPVARTARFEAVGGWRGAPRERRERGVVGACRQDPRSSASARSAISTRGRWSRASPGGPTSRCASTCRRAAPISSRPARSISGWCRSSSTRATPTTTRSCPTCRSRRSPPSIRWRCSRASRSSASGRLRSTSARARRPAWSGCSARGTSASARPSSRRRRTSARCSPRPTRRC